MQKLNEITGLEEDSKIFYYGIELNHEQVKEIEGKEIEFYSMNRQTLFEIRDRDGNKTGKYMMYIIWR